MAWISSLQFRFISPQPSICVSKHRISLNVLEFRTELRFDYRYLYWNRRKTERNFLVRVYSSLVNSDDDKSVGDEVVKMESNIVDSENPVGRLRGTISSFPPVIFVIKRNICTNFAVGLGIVIAFLVIVVREYVVRKSRYNRPGSVANLVKRGQLRSDRRGISQFEVPIVTYSLQDNDVAVLVPFLVYSSKPLKYDDPFNNPLVKVGKSNSTIEMCGKVYRLAPVTLTEEQQSIHQKRRSRAYQWKRPTMFIKEGDSIPPDVDPDTVRWIPANHPFATTVSDIDENLAQNNVYQKHGVPFRIQAEHEALQRKLEALQSVSTSNPL
ncbi:hypothetical protein HHK36_002415 [Tetracentron sinense]|uniref:Protein MULTIPLE CHLOROPLAST DIVISION SITE 1 n=1 Tax=Tetracentron sinense TaxID=13715 RepID=A0A834ZWD2_TETSI|nr:hypothetical protein HHK36_002415 [Tetracentron sinense]